MADQPSKLVAFHQYSGPLAMLLLGFAAVVLAACSGYALIVGTFEAASFVAVSGQFFGLLGAVFGVQAQNRAGGGSRSSDKPNGTPPSEAAPTATATVNVGGP